MDYPATNKKLDRIVNLLNATLKAWLHFIAEQEGKRSTGLVVSSYSF